MAEVSLTQLTKSFGATQVIPPIDLTLEDGSFSVLVGPSGCGKSTLLRLIAGLEEATSGSVRIGGEDVTRLEPAERGIAMVFQSYALYPHMSVAANIGFALKLAGLPKSEITRRVGQAAEILRLTPYLSRKPRDLSGGQRQRVAIGRAIVRNPKVFLFDEPLSNLDAALRSEMRVELADLHRQLGATMIYVTHDQIEAMTMADKIVVLNGGQVEQSGTPMDLYNRPRTEFVAKFIGSPMMNLIGGAVASSFGAELIGIRPEHIHLAEQGWSGKIRHAENYGSDTMVHVELSDMDPVTFRVVGQCALRAGDTVTVSPDPNHLHRFAKGLRIT